MKVEIKTDDRTAETIMKIIGIIWLDEIIEKLATKHQVEISEVIEVLVNKPKFHLVEKGDREGENVYIALGRTNTGRYLTLVFIYKKTREAMILSARDMEKKEKRQYDRK